MFHLFPSVSLLTHSQDARSKIAGVLNFVNDNDPRPIKLDADPTLSQWYQQHSRVYVADNHACWADKYLARKVDKKGFGAVMRSSTNGLARMMQEHSSDAQDWILSQLTERQKGGDTTEDDKLA
jgi:histone deacetylase 6